MPGINLYAPVETPDAGLAVDFRPLQDAVTAIMQRRAQMKQHEMSLAAQKAQHEASNALGWAQLAETKKHHGDEKSNWDAQRTADSNKLAQDKAVKDQLELDKAKAAETQGFQALRQDVQGPGGDSISSPQAQALRAQLTAGGIHATQRQMMTSPMVSDPGVVGAPAGQSSPISPGGLSMEPMTLPETGHEVVDYEGPKTGASFTHDPLQEIIRRRAAGNAAASRLENEAKATGGELGDNVARAAPDAVRAAIMAGIPEEKAVKDAQGLPIERTKLDAAERNATRISISTGEKNAGLADQNREHVIRDAVKTAVAATKMPALTDGFQKLGAIEERLKKGKGNFDAAAIKEELVKAAINDRVSDADYARMSPDDKNGLFTAASSRVERWFSGRQMNEKTRQDLIASVRSMRQAKQLEARAIQKQVIGAQTANGNNVGQENVINELEQSNFGMFNLPPIGSAKPNQQEADRKTRRVSQGKHASVSTKGGSTLDEVNALFGGK